MRGTPGGHEFKGVELAERDGEGKEQQVLERELDLAGLAGIFDTIDLLKGLGHRHRAVVGQVNPSQPKWTEKEWQECE